MPSNRRSLAGASRDHAHVGRFVKTFSLGQKIGLLFREACTRSTASEAHSSLSALYQESSVAAVSPTGVVDDAVLILLQRGGAGGGLVVD